MDTKILVYVDLNGKPNFVGSLWTRQSKGKDSASFEYAKTWLNNPNKFALEPLLALQEGGFYTQGEKAIFGAIGDSSPDRWGRVLIQREERRKAKLEERAPRTLSEADYLLGVNDITRQGALRFALEEGGDLLASGDKASVPPLVRLAELLNAANKINQDEYGDSDLKLILAPGSSLGGARAKASVIDNDGNLAIAKFPQADDSWPVITWEMVALKLAEQAKVITPTNRIEKVAGHDVLLLTRFDRKGKNRIPFISAMSMLGAADNQQHSYLEIADSIKAYGSKPAEDLKQLWRRIVFNILISNTDDHLRNHGFLVDGNGWVLSPAYDMNPTPADICPRVLSLAIDETDSTASLELAFSVIKHFGIKAAEAKIIAAEVGKVVSGWEKAAKELGLKAKDISRMESAFVHDDLKLALKN